MCRPNALCCVTSFSQVSVFSFLLSFQCLVDKVRDLDKRTRLSSLSKESRLCCERRWRARSPARRQRVLFARFDVDFRAHMRATGGKKKPLKAPKKEERELDDDDIAFKKKQAEEKKALDAAKQRAGESFFLSFVVFA